MWDDMCGHTYWKSRKKSFTVSSKMRRGTRFMHVCGRGRPPLLNDWTRARLNLLTSQGPMVKMSFPAEPCVLLIWVFLSLDFLKSRMCQISRVINRTGCHSSVLLYSLHQHLFNSIIFSGGREVRESAALWSDLVSNTAEVVLQRPSRTM